MLMFAEVQYLGDQRGDTDVMICSKEGKMVICYQGNGE